MQEFWVLPHVDIADDTARGVRADEGTLRPLEGSLRTGRKAVNQFLMQPVDQVVPIGPLESVYVFDILQSLQ